MPDKLIPRMNIAPAIHMPVPTYIQIEPTFKCNLKCSQCFRSFYRRDHLNLDPEKFDLILEQLPGLEVIKLQGLGEILLYEDLETILKKGREKNIEFVTITNGILISEENADFLLNYFNNIYISIDSLQKERFLELRGGASFETVFKGLEILSQKKEKYKTRLGINFVISHKNYDEIPLLAGFTEKYNLDILSLVEVENWFLPTQEQYKENSKYIKKAREYSQIIKESVDRLIEVFNKMKKEIYFVSSEKRKKACPWPFYMTCITCDGNVIPCCLRANPELSSMGNIFETDFKDIWNGKKYVEVREGILKNRPSINCDNCPD